MKLTNTYAFSVLILISFVVTAHGVWGQQSLSLQGGATEGRADRERGLSVRGFWAAVRVWQPRTLGLSSTFLPIRLPPVASARGESRGTARGTCDARGVLLRKSVLAHECRCFEPLHVLPFASAAPVRGLPAQEDSPIAYFSSAVLVPGYSAVQWSGGARCGQFSGLRLGAAAVALQHVLAPARGVSIVV